MRVAGFLFAATACSSATAPEVKVPREFFGHMVSGGLLDTPQVVDIPIGTFRDWNTGASYEWVYKNDWLGFERAISFARTKKASLLHVLAGDPATPLPPITEWQSYVREAVSRSAGRIPAWEPLNEAVYVASPAQAVEYAAAAREIIQQDPTARVTSPSFADLTQGYAQQYLEECLRLGIEKYSDALAFHSYDTREQLAQVIALLQARTSLPLWNTETVGIETLALQAEKGIKRVVLNAQIPGNEDTSSTSPLGRIYCASYEELVS